ncbi:hypothetical protein ACEZHJ_00595 [Arhodomonas sp. KWT2]
MAESQSIRCLVVPVGGVQWLVPAAVVAEVTDPGTAVPEGGHDRLAGFADWRGRRIPLMRPDDDTPATHGGSRLLVLKALSGTLPVSHYGVVTQGIPRIASVTMDTLAPGDAGVDDERFIPVLAAGESALLPRLDALEPELASALAAAGGVNP